MAVLLSNRSCANLDNVRDSWQGLHGAGGSRNRHSARMYSGGIGASVADRAAVKLARRQLKRAERAAFRTALATGAYDA